MNDCYVFTSRSLVTAPIIVDSLASVFHSCGPCWLAPISPLDLVFQCNSLQQWELPHLHQGATFCDNLRLSWTVCIGIQLTPPSEDWFTCPFVLMIWPRDEPHRKHRFLQSLCYSVTWQLQRIAQNTVAVCVAF
jgi:hypothetical protein